MVPRTSVSQHFSQFFNKFRRASCEDSPLVNPHNVDENISLKHFLSAPKEPFQIFLKWLVTNWWMNSWLMNSFAFHVFFCRLGQCPQFDSIPFKSLIDVRFCVLRKFIFISAWWFDLTLNSLLKWLKISSFLDPFSTFWRKVIIPPFFSKFLVKA